MKKFAHGNGCGHSARGHCQNCRRDRRLEEAPDEISRRDLQRMRREARRKKRP